MHCSRLFLQHERISGASDLPIPKKKRYATRAASKPDELPPAPYDPAPSAAKRMMMIVDTKSDHLREKWSDV